MSANGVPVAAIQTTMQTAHGNTHSRKLFHNEVAKARDEFLDKLYELLKESIRYLRVLLNDSGEVNCLFVAFPSPVAFARRYF